MRKADLAVAALFLLPLQGLAQDLPSDMPVRPEDRQRLENFDAAAGEALLQALAGGEDPDRRILIDALGGKPRSAEEAVPVLAGEWACRTIKVGGLLPVTAYDPFRCRISGNGEFEKLSGSQRSKGRIYRDGERLVYLGTGFIAGDTPPDYAELPEETDPQALPQILPEVGLVEAVSENRIRILFPYPHLESRFNILLLER